MLRPFTSSRLPLSLSWPPLSCLLGGGGPTSAVSFATGGASGGGGGGIIVSPTGGGGSGKWGVGGGGVDGGPSGGGGVGGRGGRGEGGTEGGVAARMKTEGVTSMEMPSAAEAAVAVPRADVRDDSTAVAVVLAGVAMVAVMKTEAATTVIDTRDGSTPATAAIDDASAVVFV